MTEKEWYDMQELADEWGVPVGRVRTNSRSLEAIGAIVTRDKPGDGRYKQVHRDSVETLKKAVVGG